MGLAYGGDDMVKKLALEVFKTTIVCLFYCAIVMAVIYACLGCYHFGFQIFSNPVCDKNAVSMKQIEVASADQEMEIMKHLQDEGMIEDYRVAYIRLQFSEYKDKLQPGTYEVSAAMPMDDILATLAHMSETDLEVGQNPGAVTNGDLQKSADADEVDDGAETDEEDE